MQQLRAFPPAVMLAYWDYLQPLQASRLPLHELFLNAKTELCNSSLL